MNEYRITYIMAIFSSLILWTLTICKTRIFNLQPPDAFHYIKQLPIEYWIGIFILLCLIVIKLFYRNLFLQNRTLYDALLIAVLALYLFGTQSFVYPNPIGLDTYGHISRSIYILNTGYSDSALDYYVTGHPGAFTFFSFILSFAEISPIILIKIYQPLLVFLLAILIYLITREVMGSSYALIAPLTFLSLTWTGEYHISPQSYGLALYLAFWFLIVKMVFCGGKVGKWFSLLFLIAFSIVISHPGTPIFIILNLGILIPICYFIKNIRPPLFDYYKRLFNIVLIFTIMWLAWMVHKNGTNFDIIIKDIYLAIKNAYSGFQPALSKPSIPSPSYQIIEDLKRCMGIFGGLIGILSIFVIWMKGYKRECLFFGGWFISCFSFIFIGMYMGGSYIERPFLFSALPLGVLVSIVFQKGEPSSTRFDQNKWLKIFKSVAITGILAFIILNPIAKNGSDPFDNYPTSTLAGVKFGVDYGHGRVMLRLLHLGYVKYYIDLRNRSTILYNISFSGMEFDLEKYQNPEVLKENNMIGFFDAVYNSFELQQGMQNFSEIDKKCERKINNDFNRIYDNGGSRIYNKP